MKILKHLQVIVVAIMLFVSTATVPVIVNAWGWVWTVNLVVAGDEEMRASTYIVYSHGIAHDVDWKSYADYEIGYSCFLGTWRGLRLFPITSVYFRIIGYVDWWSPDDVFGDSLGESMVNSLGWMVPGGRQYNGLTGDILVGFTGQSSFSGGFSYEASDAVLIEFQRWWADDNVVLHEILHLYGCPDHLNGENGYYDDCIMTSRPEFVHFVVEEGTGILLESTIGGGYVTTKVCMDCFWTVERNRAAYGEGRETGWGGHGGGHFWRMVRSEMPVNTTHITSASMDPLPPDLNPVEIPLEPILITIAAIIVVAVVLYLVIRTAKRLGRRRRE